MARDIRWAAQLSGVREVSLFGAADAGYWSDRLAREDLAPALTGGRARVMIVSASSSFKGIRFRELSVSVLAARPGEAPGGAGAFLVGAFNSSRLFAFCERAFFSTPYEHGRVAVVSSAPASVRVEKGGQLVFHAGMAAAPPTSPQRPGGWEGPVFLPRSHRESADGGRMFFARIRGQTLAQPFRAGEDALEMRPHRHGDAIHALVESKFAPMEWEVRDDATHAKSKTYRRDASPPAP